MARDDEAGGGNAEDEVEARRRRLDALHALAGAPPDAPMGATPTTRRTPRSPLAPRRAPIRGWRPRGWWLALGAAVCLAALVAAIVVPRLFHQPAPGATRPARVPNPLTIALGQAGLGCPYAAAWSPDGTLLAILAHDKGCSGSIRAAVYTTITGKLLALLRPADLMNAAVANSGPGASSSPGALYVDGVHWSRDGSHLALTYITYAQFATTSNPALVNGLYLSDSDGSHARAFAAEASAAPYTTVWNLAASVEPVAQMAPPPALGYSWGKDDALIPNTPLGATAPPAPPLGPVGLPDGGSPFTIWQPGTLNFMLTNPNTLQAEPPGAFSYTTYFAAWSPDGRYLADGLGVTARLQAATMGAPSAQALRDFGLASDPLLPVRDAALERVLEASATPISPSLSLAWRPDGLMLAAQPIGGSSVNLYDCTSGELIGTVTPTTPSQVTPGTPTATNITNATPNALRWSPDGTRLLALDGISDSITIWGPGVLPK